MHSDSSAHCRAQSGYAPRAFAHAGSRSHRIGSRAAAFWVALHAQKALATRSIRSIRPTRAAIDASEPSALRRRAGLPGSVAETLVELWLEPLGRRREARPSHHGGPFARPIDPVVAHAEPHEERATPD